MSTPVVVRKQTLRSGGAMPKSTGVGCGSVAPPTQYVIQSFGVEISSIDSFDSITGMFGSEVMQGLQNFEDTDSFRASAYVRVSYNGTNYRNTDGAQIFKGTEEHSAKWVEEDDLADGLIWLS